MSRPPQDDRRPHVSRRAVLGAVATGGAAISGGCLQQLRTVGGWDGASPLELTIKTVPADSDPYAPLIARKLGSWLQAAGIRASIVPMSGENLLRDVLLSHNFDLFVGQFPSVGIEPETLYSLLHSRYGGEPGWQNPFGYADIDTDGRLETLVAGTGHARRQAIRRLQNDIAERVPFVAIAFPELIRAVGSDGFTNWAQSMPESPLSLLSLLETEHSDGTLRLATTDNRATLNLNPLAAEFRRRGLITGLLYDPLVYSDGEELFPWLVRSWSREEDRLRLRLRDDLQWHDGEPLTADDVTFTYDFLADTSLGERDQPVPATRFRGQVSLVEGTRAVDDSTVLLDVGDATTPIWALTIPILPRHVWRERTGEASIMGIDVGGTVTQALVTNNVPPVGSGPLGFEAATQGESVRFTRYDDHFLTTSPDGVPDAAMDGPAFDQLRIDAVGSDSTAVELVADGQADATTVEMGPNTVPRIGREKGLELHVQHTDAFYFVGFNTRNAPLANPRFRNAVSHLVDRGHLLEEVFDGYARPTISPLANTEHLPDDLIWTGSDPVAPFAGSDGVVDADRARDLFRDAGYQYDDENNLLTY